MAIAYAGINGRTEGSLISNNTKQEMLNIYASLKDNPHALIPNRALDWSRRVNRQMNGPTMEDPLAIVERTFLENVENLWPEEARDIHRDYQVRAMQAATMNVANQTIDDHARLRNDIYDGMTNAMMGTIQAGPETTVSAVDHLSPLERVIEDFLDDMPDSYREFFDNLCKKDMSGTTDGLKAVFEMAMMVEDLSYKDVTQIAHLNMELSAMEKQ